MPTVLLVLQEAGHWGATVPLAVCLYLSLRKREPSPDAWLLSCAFFVSFIADQVMAWMAEQQIRNWWVTYLSAPVQFGLFAAVVARAKALRWVSVAGILLVAVVSALRGTLGSPETIVQVIGGALVSLVLLEQSTPFKVPILTYCLGTMPGLLIMGAWNPSLTGPWIWGWSGYQVVRLIALGMMVVVLWRSPFLRLEASDGTGTGPVTARRRASDRAVGSDRRDELAAPAQRKSG